MTKEEQLQKLGIREYHIDSKGQITVYQNINWSNKNLKKIPIKFYQVWGNVDFSNNLLTSLKNSPTHIYGEFNCSNNKLKSFKYGPYFIEDQIDITNNVNFNSFDYWPIMPNRNYFSTSYNLDVEYNISEEWKVFGEAQIMIYHYCKMRFFWKPELTVNENVEMLLKYKPEALEIVGPYLIKLPDYNNQSYRGLVYASNIGII